MTAETSTYQRLPGKKKGFLIGHHTLWQGADHLLQIYSRLGVEDYKRYYFDDIQAIITRKTGSGRIQNIVIGTLFGLFCLFAVMMSRRNIISMTQADRLKPWDVQFFCDTRHFWVKRSSFPMNATRERISRMLPSCLRKSTAGH